MITRDRAERFACEWVEAWNAHDLDAILSHYHDDFEMASPRIATVVGEPSGVLHGKAAIGAYWKKALAVAPDLHFELLAVFVGAKSVALHYQGPRGPAVETFELDEQGRVLRAAAHYP